MLDFLYNLDLQVFYFINHTISNPIFNKFFPFITDINHWYLVYVVLWLIMFTYGGRKGKIAAIMVLFVIICSDQLSSHYIKDFFHRVRPCNALPDVWLRISATDSYSFPSSHAVNNFALAFFIYKIFPKYKYVAFTTAFLLALSRPYVGVHYPSDILGGAIIGSLIGYIFGLLTNLTDNWFEKRNSEKSNNFERIKKI